MRKQPKTDYPFSSLSCRGDLEGQKDGIDGKNIGSKKFSIVK
jgi:hypothetical protein